MSTEPQRGVRVRRLGVAALGVAALGLAIVLVVVEIVAVAVGSARQWELATVLAWVVIVLTAVSFAGGLAAVVLRRGRAWGVAAMIVSVLGNPLVQVWVLGLGGTS